MAVTAKTVIQTEYGPFDVAYHRIGDKKYVSFSLGNISIGKPLVRLHSACLFGEAFHSLHCDCAQQLNETLKLIVERGGGVLVYGLDEEGRGIGLENKIKSMEIERTENIDMVDAFTKLGFEADARDFKSSAAVLADLNCSRTIVLLSDSPAKQAGLEAAGFVIEEKISTPVLSLSDLARKEHQTKKDRLGYS